MNAPGRKKIVMTRGLFRRTALIAALLVPAALTAGDDAAMRPRLAVMRFSTYNCAPALGNATSEMVAGPLFDTGCFEMLERNRMDLVLRERGIGEAGCSDRDCASRLGKVLSVQKMVVGSVSAAGQHRLDVRVINVADSRVDLALSESARSENDCERAASKIARRIARYYGKRRLPDLPLSLSGTAAYLQPAGDLRRGAGAGFGGFLNTSIDDIPALPFGISLHIGAFDCASRRPTIQSITVMPASLTIMREFTIAGGAAFTPYAGAGYIMHWIRYDRVDYRAMGDYRYRDGVFYNPCLHFRFEWSLEAARGLDIVCTPVYMIFFERGRAGHLPGIEAGLRIRL